MPKICPLCRKRAIKVMHTSDHSTIVDETTMSRVRLVRAKCTNENCQFEGYIQIGSPKILVRTRTKKAPLSPEYYT
jgi:hypothetical protein